MRCIILSGGTIENIDWLAGKINHDDHIICVDSGARYAIALGITPDTIVGDLDSIDPADLDYLIQSGGTRIIKYSPDKDDTDTALALKEAMARKPDEIIIFGATGSRMDHTWANMQLLYMAAQSGMRAKIMDQHNIVELLLPGCPVTIRGTPGSTFSLLPLSFEVQGINIIGARWPLTNASIQTGDTIGVSNRLAGDKAKILIGSGLALLIRVVTEDYSNNTE